MKKEAAFTLVCSRCAAVSAALRPASVAWKCCAVAALESKHHRWIV
ncbi:hypothetical protein WN944_000748 [Citrus x changshan-huyou]|uniref:Uncharacterized protein n=1 Tax=Citrus x changshan-huyou TaxID=2935761 RepID=A0AAP0MDG4_9ROSI